MLSKFRYIVKFIKNMLSQHIMDSSLINYFSYYTSEEDLDELEEWLNNKIKESEDNNLIDKEN